MMVMVNFTMEEAEYLKNLTQQRWTALSEKLQKAIRNHQIKKLERDIKRLDIVKKELE